MALATKPMYREPFPIGVQNSDDDYYPDEMEVDLETIAEETQGQEGRRTTVGGTISRIGHMLMRFATSVGRFVTRM
ncbi:hypothetical protein HWV62_42512 [Athelia sp. TMB]|nr:hypothetical protein HWV62_42512 [Athelia sp. TMB]